MRAVLMFHNCEGESHKTVSADHNFLRERRAEADSNRGPSAYQPNALPLGQTGSQVLPEKRGTVKSREQKLQRGVSRFGLAVRRYAGNNNNNNGYFNGT